MKRYYVYITTNKNRTVLYTGITGSLERRLSQHLEDAVFQGQHFAGKYQSFYLLYFEEFMDVRKAIAREKEIKGWRREKKMKLICSVNPEFNFLTGFN